MIRFLFLRIIPLLVLFWLLRSVLRAIVVAVNSSAMRQAQPNATAQTGGELKKDPVCGTFVSIDTSVSKRVNGEVVHFCSTACRDKYRVAS